MEKVAGLLAESNARKKNMVCTFYFVPSVDIQIAQHNVEATVVDLVLAHASAHIITCDPQAENLLMNVICGHFTRFEMT